MSGLGCPGRLPTAAGFALPLADAPRRGAGRRQGRVAWASWPGRASRCRPGSSSPSTRSRPRWPPSTRPARCGRSSRRSAPADLGADRARLRRAARARSSRRRCRRRSRRPSRPATRRSAARRQRGPTIARSTPTSRSARRPPSRTARTASFAGLQDTYLGVAGTASVLEHVRRCWASLYNDESVAYRRRLGLPEAGVCDGRRRAADGRAARGRGDVHPVTGHRRPFGGRDRGRPGGSARRSSPAT